MKSSLCVPLLAACGLLLAPQEAKDRRLQQNLKDTDLVGAWVYDDLPAGIEEARRSGKPLMVVYRCVP